MLDQVKIQRVKKVLGPLKRYKDSDDDLEGLLTLESGKKATILISLEGKAIDEVLHNVSDNIDMFVTSADTIKAAIADDLLDSINEDWREDDAKEITREQLFGLLTLDGIQVFSSGAVTMHFIVDDLLGGHNIEISYNSMGHKKYEAQIIG